MSDDPNDDLNLAGISSVTWTGDDGTTYKRVFHDGEIKDIEVSGVSIDSNRRPRAKKSEERVSDKRDLVTDGGHSTDGKYRAECSCGWSDTFDNSADEFAVSTLDRYAHTDTDPSGGER